MEEKLDEVRRLLNRANMTGGGTEQLSHELEIIRSVSTGSGSGSVRPGQSV